MSTDYSTDETSMKLNKNHNTGDVPSGFTPSDILSCALMEIIEIFSFSFSSKNHRVRDVCLQWFGLVNIMFLSKT